MESRSYMFSTAKKRSTLLESKGIEFPREEATSPRMLIMQRECPPEFEAFKSCMQKNQSNPERCAPLREELFACGKPGIRKANTDKTYLY